MIIVPLTHACMQVISRLLLQVDTESKSFSTLVLAVHFNFYILQQKELFAVTGVLDQDELQYLPQAEGGLSNVRFLRTLLKVSVTDYDI